MRYFCPECGEKFRKWKNAIHHKKETGHGAFKCNECDEYNPTKSALARHKLETGHVQYTDNYFGQNQMSIKKQIEKLQQGTNQEIVHEIETIDIDNHCNLHVTIDAQNTINGDNNDIVTLIHILKQLNLFAEKIDYSPKIETVIPGWLVKNNGKYDYHENLEPHTRLIKIFINNKDSELDDYLAVSIAAANEGFYLSNDKKMHGHIRKNDQWRDCRRIGFRQIRETNQIRLIFPEGELADKYNELFENGDLNIEFEEWETNLRAETIEKEELKLKNTPKKYFCPDCDEEFVKWGGLTSHRRETGHASIFCEDCGEILPTKKRHETHRKETEHTNYLGNNVKPSEAKIENKEISIQNPQGEVIEKSPETQTITNGISNQNERTIWALTANPHNKNRTERSKLLWPSNPAVTSAIFTQIKSLSGNEISWNECRTQINKTNSLANWKMGGLFNGLRSLVERKAGKNAVGRWRDPIAWNHTTINLPTIESLQELTLNYEWSGDQKPPETWTTEVTEYFEEVKKYYAATE